MKNKKPNSLNATKEALKDFSISDYIKIRKFDKENADLTKEEKVKLFKNIHPEIYAKFCKLMGSEV